jgi:hypothetical protein
LKLSVKEKTTVKVSTEGKTGGLTPYTSVRVPFLSFLKIRRRGSSGLYTFVRLPFLLLGVLVVLSSGVVVGLLLVVGTVLEDMIRRCRGWSAKNGKDYAMIANPNLEK